MAMLSEGNHLEHFKELHLLPRAIFLIGFVLFVAAVFKWELVLVLGSMGIIFLGVGMNFILNLIYREGMEPYKLRISWASLIQAAISLCLATALICLGVYSYRHGVLPTAFRPVPSTEKTVGSTH
jgi:hypothetical protein